MTHPATGSLKYYGAEREKTMAYYAISYVYAAPEEQDKYRPAHREYLAAQIDSNS